LKKRKIVITGGPSTGKSTVVDELKNRNFNCFDEVSRDIIKEAKQQGIEQLFLTDPLLFSQKLLEGRVKQSCSIPCCCASLIISLETSSKQLKFLFFNSSITVDLPVLGPPVITIFLFFKIICLCI